jgi:RimJ/RimL family protein N-acetyltransferase
VKAPVQVETTRLLLRQPRAADATSIFERYASDPDVTRFLGWLRHQSLADTQAFLFLLNNSSLIAASHRGSG